MRRQKTSPTDDTDAVSVTTGYILNIGIATLVLSTLLLGMQGTFDNVEETTTTAQAQNVAEKVANEITQADRLARVDSNVSGTLTFELRDSISDSDYSVIATQGWVNVTTTGRTVSREYNVTSDVDGRSIDGGGTVSIEYNGSSDPPGVTVVG
jgi:hypothetical protein